MLSRFERQDAWGHAAITGASSGIGAALARRLAVQPRILSLAGRDAHRLDGVVAACAGQGAVARGSRVDVTRPHTLRAWMERRAPAGPIDLLVANAGVIDDPDRSPREVAEVNFVGIINTVEAALPYMARHGQIAVLSSLAAWRAQPSAPVYAASKAAVRLYAEAIRGRLERQGLTISIVSPGFVATPMLNRWDGAKRQALTAEQAAEIIIDGLARRQPTIAFPRAMYAKARLMAVLPATLVEASAWLAGRARQQA
ncbi:MAG: SDR family NAD(P)-dependent oxidoreductase [Geminicoccaceae bacterium]